MASSALFIALFSAALFLGGVEAGTIVLAAAIGGLALVRPRTALWASTAFMVYLFMFFQKAPLVRPELPFEFYYWGAGLAIITLGLCVARFRARPRPTRPAKTVHQIRFDRAMFLIFLVSLVASIYGLARGNGLFVVARQLFGCLLLPLYYLLAGSLFRTAEDVNHWVHRVGWAVVAGSAWYTAKLGFVSLSESEYYREQSPMGFFAGAIAAVFFVEFLQDRRFANRIRKAAAFAICVLAVMLMGARFVAGSLAATAIIFAILRWRKRRVALVVSLLALLSVIIPYGVTAMEAMMEQTGVVAQIASRFSPFDLNEDLSYVGRAAQWSAVVDVVRQHPILGGGMGAEIAFFDPDFPEISSQGPYVDNGWGFVLLKMGFVGLSIFLFLMGSAFWCGIKTSSELAPEALQRTQKCLLVILLFGLLSFTGGPTFFHFTQSGFLATALGGLAVLSGAHTQTQEASRGGKSRSLI